MRQTLYSACIIHICRLNNYCVCALQLAPRQDAKARTKASDNAPSPLRLRQQVTRAIWGSGRYIHDEKSNICEGLTMSSYVTATTASNPRRGYVHKGAKLARIGRSLASKASLPNAHPSSLLFTPAGRYALPQPAAKEEKEAEERTRLQGANQRPIASQLAASNQWDSSQAPIACWFQCQP